jgi:pyruvate-ferredoxin/flavodoxin oxidoreductase
VANFLTIDGNEATTLIAHKCNEVMAIYPITPSSGMGEMADEWSAKGQKNIFGTVPHVVELQSEGGASGAVHGSLQAGALTSTFTASQGLLLMVPNMFKIAGELTSTVFHVSARSIATHALSIFGDHSDVMACRTTGWAFLACGSIQETHDLALVSYAATLESRIPFLHFFDGFRTSHEVSKMEPVSDETIVSMIDLDLVAAHRDRALSPDAPKVRGTAQNPDVFFQAREACNKYYDAAPSITQKAMDKFGELTGRKYNLFDYVGAEDAEHVIVAMGSGIGVIEEAVDYLVAAGAKVGMVKVRLYRPFDMDAFVGTLPKTVKKIAALDRTKEPGSTGEPLFQDVVLALCAKWEGEQPAVIGGRYGLSSKDFTPAMVKAIYDELAKDAPKKTFTIGINDDVTNLSLDYDPTFSTETEDITRAVFYGLGSDGTVGANKNSVKIVGEHTEQYAQGYFEYDSKKAGSVTISHLRFSPRPIKGSYLIGEANFVACHQSVFIERLDMLKKAQEGAIFLLNTIAGPDEVWDTLPVEMQQEIIDKKLKFYVINAYKIAEEAGMGLFINTIMQTCFFKLTGAIPAEEAIGYIKEAIKKTFASKGEEVIATNIRGVDAAIAGICEVNYPQEVTSSFKRMAGFSGEPTDFVRNTLGEIMSSRGDALPVSALSVDGTFPTATTQFEKRCIALTIPIWEPDLCIQCGQCTMVCPHAVIRFKKFKQEELEGAPETFKSAAWRTKEFPGEFMSIQPSPEDCTGCGMCVEVCPAKDKEVEGRKAINMTPKEGPLPVESANWKFWASLPDVPRTDVQIDTMRGSQLLRPLFEFSGACAGCGETPYVRLVTQLFGDRMVIANATGCSSIYGGNLPSTPYCVNEDGRGPAWSNSLFEDNAEFGFGMRLAMDQQQEYAQTLLKDLSGEIGDATVDRLIDNPQSTEAEIAEQRKLVADVKAKFEGVDCDKAKALITSADYLVDRSMWIFGGDGWAYDIGYGGLDHVLASGRNVNILVMDTEVYSNTGGQASKATPLGAVAKFAASGKPTGKKDLGMIAATYGDVFVGQIAMGANPMHTLRTLIQAESYPGVSLVIAYSHCIAHGIKEMKQGMDLQKQAVQCGYWPLYTFDPRNEQPFKLISKPPKGEFADFADRQNRFTVLKRSKPEASEKFVAQAQQDILDRYDYYKQLSEIGSKDEE